MMWHHVEKEFTRLVFIVLLVFNFVHGISHQSAKPLRREIKLTPHSHLRRTEVATQSEEYNDSSEKEHSDEISDDDRDSDNCSDEEGVGEGAEEKTAEKRSLMAGDVFTPHELLPVTERLLKKVDLPPNVGRGIVSSSKSPEDLADRIFAAYFLTTKRIVILNDDAIPGLDALQALAIEGNPQDYRYIVRTVSIAPQIVILKPDKVLKSHLPPRRSRYKLLTKKESKSRKAVARKRDKQSRKNIMVQLEKKLKKNRHIVVNPGKKRKSAKRVQSFRRALRQPGCTWRYECRDPHDLETCNLKAKCNNDTLSNGHMNDIITPAPVVSTVSAQFRRAVGLSVIDEEVEKIIEGHVLLIRPENLQNNSVNMESLDEYFNKLVMGNNFAGGSTTPVTPVNDTEELQKDKEECDSNEAALREPENNKEKYHSAIPYGIPLRVNTNTRRPRGPKSKKSLKKLYRDTTKKRVTPKIVQLLG